MANEAKIVRGSTTVVITMTSDMATTVNNYSGQTGFTATALDNSSLNYPYAEAVMECAAFAVTATAGTGVELWMCKQDIDGTNDTVPAPVSTDLKSAQYVGFFPVVPLDTSNAQRIPIVISLEGVKGANFFLKNATAQTLKATITCKITPFSYGPT
jgi:hypothetical protein